MRRLIVKELRQLLPIGYLWLAVLVFSYSIRFFSERIDEQTFGGWCEGICDYSGNTAVTIFSALIALVTAYSLFPREHDDGTIDFLRSLPISRRSLFLSKAAAAWILLVAITVLSYSIDALLLASNPESLGGLFYWQAWFTLLWRDCLFAFIILCHGILLSWFRTLGLILYAVYLFGLMWVESATGSSGVWSVFSLLSNEYQGSELIVNSRALTIHSVVAVIMLFVAYRLWNRTDSRMTGGKEKTQGSRVFQVLLSLFAFLMIVAVLVDKVGVGTGTSKNENQKVIATDHYRFFYNEAQSDVVSYLVDYAERDLQALGELLNIDDLPSMRVDLTAQSEHAAGLAKWKKILMDLDSFDDDISQRRVLSHETTHVLQATESDRALADNHAATKFFIEGMAQYTSFEVVPEEIRRRSNWELAAVAWQRQSIEFADLINAGAFAEKFDVDLHYSLGDLWTKAMVDTCGIASLGDFVRATGRSDAVSNLSAAIFWRDTTRVIGCDLDTVNVTWQTQMQALVDNADSLAYPKFSNISVDKDPATQRIRIRASLSAAADGVSPLKSGAATDGNVDIETDQADTRSSNRIKIPARFTVRIGRISTQLSAGVDPQFRGRLKMEEGVQTVEFLIPESIVPGTRFRYQLGYTPSDDGRYYYEAWRRGAKPSSASEP